jgi:hypothetical protein
MKTGRKSPFKTPFVGIQAKPLGGGGQTGIVRFKKSSSLQGSEKNRKKIRALRAHQNRPISA